MNSLFLPPNPLSPTPSAQDRDPAVLICRYVGFPLILDKCPYLKSKVCVTVVKNSNQNSSISNENATGIKIQVPVPDPPRSYKDWVLQQKNKEESLIRDRNNGSSSSTPAGPVSASTGVGVISPSMVCSNALVCVSKRWSAACKAALYLEWRRGSCAEWRVVSELMSSDRVTKVIHLSLSTRSHTTVNLISFVNINHSIGSNYKYCLNLSLSLGGLRSQGQASVTA
jgi:hypothetical protein